METIVSSSSSSEDPAADDLLSELPTDVLISILEKLCLRDAVRAGVLSRQWRSLPAQLPRLALDIESFLPGGGAARDFDDHDKGVDNNDGNGDGTQAADDDDDSGGYRDVFSEAGDKMADVATALLASRTPAAAGNGGGATTTTLAIRLYLRHNYMSLGRLLDDAVASGKVRRAELTIGTTYDLSLQVDGQYDRESTERALVGYGRRFRALFDACPLAFGALTCLSLDNMRNRVHEWSDILTVCTSLEKLSLYSCGPGLRELWSVRHAQLKDIVISWCDIRGVKLVWLPRLERLTLQGWFLTADDLVSLGHVPSLTTVTLSKDSFYRPKTLKLSCILANNLALNDLRLNLCGNNLWFQPETSIRLTDAFSKLKNLKIRNVHRECGLAWTMFLLQSAPHLQDLYIKTTDHDCKFASRKNVPWEVATNFKHYNLARVKIVGFHSTQQTIVTYIRCLVAAAVNLEEICMRENTRSFCVFCGQPEPEARSRFPTTEQDKIAFRERISDGGTSAATVKIHIQS